MKRSYFVILLFSICLITMELCAVKGSTGWWIFRRPQSTKPKSITSVVAVRGDLSGIFYNPSILATIKQREVFLLAELGMVSDVFGGILYGQPHRIAQGGGIAAGVICYNAGRETLYWMEAGKPQERTVTIQRDIMGVLSYSQALTNLIFAGITVKYANSDIAETKTSSAFGLDLGILYITPFIDGLTFSLVSQNIGFAGKFIDRAEKLPTSLWVGCAYSRNLTENSYLSVGLDLPYIVVEKRTTYGVGIEYGIGVFSFNIGYRAIEESFLHIGLGIVLKSFDFGYAISPAKYLSHVHRLTIGYRF